MAAAGIQQVLQQGVQPQGVDCQLVQLGLGLLMTGLSGCGEGIQGHSGEAGAEISGSDCQEVGLGSCPVINKG